MGVFFRINKEGFVEVARGGFSNKITEKEFEKKSRFISDKKFLSKYKKSEREELEKEIKVVRMIDSYNISMVGPVVQFFIGEGPYPSGCYIGDKYFPGFYENGMIRQEAIKYIFSYVILLMPTDQQTLEVLCPII